MVKFKTQVDKNGRIYLAKPLREAGITGVVEIQPNTSTAVIYREGTPLNDILASLRIIRADLEHQLTQARARTERDLVMHAPTSPKWSSEWFMVKKYLGRKGRGPPRPSLSLRIRRRGMMK